MDVQEDMIERKGFCSNYLADLEIGSEVTMYLRASPSFHLPETSETKKPLLLGEFHNISGRLAND